MIGSFFFFLKKRLAKVSQKNFLFGFVFCSLGHFSSIRNISLEVKCVVI